MPICDRASSIALRDELNMDSASAWYSNWAWSIPLIVIHVVGLGLFNVNMVRVLTAVKSRRHFIYAFALGIGVTTIWAICNRSWHMGSRLPVPRSIA
jgi:hypothetical protein